MTFKKRVDEFFETIFRIFILVSAFTSIDMLYHAFYEKNFNLYQVPVAYYFNKLMLGFILGVVGYYITNVLLKWTKYNIKKNTLFSIIIVVPLQIMYFTKGHFTLVQNITVGFAHYIILMSIMGIYRKLYGMDYIG